jgi:hypothetical protein
VGRDERSKGIHSLTLAATGTDELNVVPSAFPTSPAYVFFFVVEAPGVPN